MKTKRSLFLVVPMLMLAVLATNGCASRINPGHVGIVVDLAGKDRGVQDYTIRTGWVFYAPWGTQIFEYPTYVQTAKWTKDPNEGNDRNNEPPDESITFTTKEAVSVNADISLSYQLDGGKVPQFYVKFRSDDLNNFTDGYLHNVSRDAFNEVGGQYTVEQVMGNNAEFLHAVEAKVSSQVQPLGVEIQQFGFIGAPRPPVNVISAINNAQQAKYRAQQSENELAQTTAEANKRVAQAEGEAQANLKLAQSITQPLLEWRKLDIQDRWISRWNGATPSVTTGGGQTPGLLLNIPDDKK